MITHLYIQNVALIDEVEVNFAHGLNILSGETGAGKSIVVDSINFLLGGRVSRDLIRAGAEFALVEGILEFEGSLDEFGLENPDGQIKLSRTMQADNGKSICRINGRVVTVSILKNVAELLVDLHGQHEHQSLLDSQKQLHILDSFCEISKEKFALENFLSEYKKINRALKNLNNIANEQLEIWRFQLDEIEKAELRADEEDALAAKRNRLSGAEKLSKNTDAAIALLCGWSAPGQINALDQLAKAAAHSAEIAKLDAAKENFHHTLSEIYTQLSEIAQDFRDYSDELDADPRELDRIETRLDLIYRLKKKYGGTIETVLKKRTELREKIDAVENSEAEIARLQNARKGISKEITNLCDEINKIRTTRAEKISDEITKILRDLGMQNAKFFIEITRKNTFSTDGNDSLEFMILPNPGEPAKPLRKIASGGEMSRIMLAIKTILTDKIPTVIFDEVDTGVSGRTAQQVAEKLLAVSRTRQILCITHLPQIAAMADTHFLIEKNFCEQRTTTSVNALSRDAAISELARLIGGAEITAATTEAAKEMKELADGLKK
ncbi:MAG: DNA repair protein RecN [Defluviitaleaceae bacterium]|nr:DNA repair protein RecN [Defluviitaleaceae bacterium]